MPGENPISASLDQARTVVRRAERRVVECVDEGYFSGEDLLPWLNRVSDVLFVLSRAVEPGARPVELAVDPAEMMSELQARGFELTVAGP